jgi:hypothetical protein
MGADPAQLIIHKDYQSFESLLSKKSWGDRSGSQTFLLSMAPMSFDYRLPYKCFIWINDERIEAAATAVYGKTDKLKCVVSAKDCRGLAKYWDSEHLHVQVSAVVLDTRRGTGDIHSNLVTLFATHASEVVNLEPRTLHFTPKEDIDLEVAVHQLQTFTLTTDGPTSAAKVYFKLEGKLSTVHEAALTASGTFQAVDV